VLAEFSTTRAVPSVPVRLERTDSEQTLEERLAIAGPDVLSAVAKGPARLRHLSALLGVDQGQMLYP
jgi:hypothetical protein